jgi:hypothetical protein
MGERSGHRILCVSVRYLSVRAMCAGSYLTRTIKRTLP